MGTELAIRCGGEITFIVGSLVSTFAKKREVREAALISACSGRVLSDVLLIVDTINTIKKWRANE